MLRFFFFFFLERRSKGKKGKFKKRCGGLFTSDVECAGRATEALVVVTVEDNNLSAESSASATFPSMI